MTKRFALLFSLALVAGCAAQNQRANYAMAEARADNMCSRYAFGSQRFMACRDYFLERYEQRVAMQQAIDAQQRAAYLGLAVAGVGMMQQPAARPMMTCNSYGLTTNCW